MSDLYTCLSNPANTNKRLTNSIRVFHKLILGILLLLVCATYSFGATVAGYSEYFIPGDEGNMYIAFNALDASASTPMHSLISVTAWADNTIIYYDHWEWAYEFDPANPDAKLTTAIPAGHVEKYVLANAGDIMVFESSNINLPRIDGVTPPTTTCTNYRNKVLVPGGPSITCYDGGDHIYVAGGAVTVTRASWIELVTVGNQSVAWEIYPVKPQLTTYTMPFGENLGFNDFNRVFILVQATADNTTFQVDLNGDGVFDTLNQNRDGDKTDPGDTNTVTLQRGQTFLIDRTSACLNGGAQCLTTPGNVNSGLLIQGNNTLQVKIVAGYPAQTYVARGFSMFPRGFWTKDYYVPLDQPTNAVARGANTDYFLYNPNASQITVTWESTTATGTFNIPAGGTVSYRAVVGNVPVDSGLYFKGTDVFWGVGVGDTGTHHLYEWGFSFLPSTMLYTEHFLGWAPDSNSNPLQAGATDNGVFLTVVQDNTTVFVDTNNDGTADMTYTLNRLQTRYITDPDGDLSQAHFWATGPFTMAYGQDADTARTPGPPGGLDLGYIAIPGSDFVSLVLTVDKSVSPQVVPTAIGSVATFTIKVDSQKYTVDGVNVTDYLPPSWQFVPGFTTITKPDLTQTSSVAAAGTVTTNGTTAVVGSGTAFSSLTAGNPITIAGVGYIIQSITDNTHLTLATNAPAAGGSTYYTISGVEPTVTGAGPYTLTWSSAQLGTNGTPGMNLNQEVMITFRAKTTAVLASGTLSQNRVKAIGTRTFGTPSQTQTFTTTDFAYVTSGAVTITKTSSAANPVSPGDRFTYTVGVANPSTSGVTLTNNSLYDALPAGVTSVAGTTLLTRSSVADAFDIVPVAYTNNNGTRNWNAAWVDSQGDGAGAGHIMIVNGELRLDNSASNEPTIQREANLLGATSAVLSFDFRTDSGVDAADTIYIRARPINTAGWTTVGTFTGITGATSGTFSIDLASFPALLPFTATAGIQFSFANNTYSSANEFFYVNNLSITYDVSVTGGTPPISYQPGLFTRSCQDKTLQPLSTSLWTTPSPQARPLSPTPPRRLRHSFRSPSPLRPRTPCSSRARAAPAPAAGSGLMLTLTGCRILASRACRT
jgi:uncharacterized repeat protein (TIGR01451 family)